MTRSTKLLFMCLLLLPSRLLFADVLPGSAQPEQINRSMIRSQPQVNVPPGSSANYELLNTQTSPLDAQAAKIKFKLNGIRLEGNKVFSTATLRAFYQADLHHIVTLQRILQIVQNITDYYQMNGYITSRAILPVQKTKGGILRIVIAEGKIDKVIVTGTPQKSACLVQQFGKRIAQKSPLQLSTLEKYTLLANEIPATQVRSILKASPNVNGASYLYLLTNHQTITGYISYDNYRTRYIGPQQTTVNLTGNSFITSGDAGQIIYARTAKGSELTFYNLNYELPLDAEGHRLLVGGIHDQTHPLFVLQPFGINGTDDNYYMTVSLPILRAATQNLTLYVKFNYENTNVTTFHQKLYTDQIRSLGFGSAYNFADQWNGVNSLYGDIRQGLPIIGYTNDTNPSTARTSRPGGHAVYTKIDLSMSHLQPILANFSFYGLLKGQYAFQTLLAAEQFPFGGIELGRGYDIAELLGDRAIAGALEARYDWSLSRFYLSTLQFYVFYDFGKVWNLFFISNLPLIQSATSTGVGMRFFFNKYISGNLTWAQPLTKQVAAEEIIGRGHNPRTFFSIVASL
jgi:hemolysin activation/secretion protein